MTKHMAKVVMKDIREAPVEIGIMNVYPCATTEADIRAMAKHFPNWQYVEWAYNGKVEYLFNETSSAQEEQ